MGVSLACHTLLYTKPEGITLDSLQVRASSPAAIAALCSLFSVDLLLLLLTSLIVPLFLNSSAFNVGGCGAFFCLQFA